MLNAKELWIYLVSFIFLILSLAAIAVNYTKRFAAMKTLRTITFFIYFFFQAIEQIILLFILYNLTTKIQTMERVESISSVSYNLQEDEVDSD